MSDIAGVVLAIVGLGFTWLVTVAGVIVWAVRLEGKVNLQTVQLVNTNDKLNTAVAALIKFDEATQKQVEDYRQHTDIKIDNLGRDIKIDLKAISEKLDGKADKP